jgi:hypothetical protein
MVKVEKDGPVTICVELEHKYYIPNSGENSKKDEHWIEVTEKTTIAIDAVAENGIVAIGRMGILGEYAGSESKYKPDNPNIEIGIKVSTIEGPAAENFENIDSVENISMTGMDKNKEKHGFGYYPVVHASSEGSLLTQKPEGYKGGGVTNETPKKTPNPVFETVIESDGEKTKCKGNNPGVFFSGTGRGGKK